MGLKDKILAINQPIPYEHSVWGLCYIRRLSAGDMRAVLATRDDALPDTENNIRFTIALCARALCEQDGTLVFTAEEVDALPFEQLNEFAEEAIKVNGLQKND